MTDEFKRIDYSASFAKLRGKTNCGRSACTLVAKAWLENEIREHIFHYLISNDTVSYEQTASTKFTSGAIR